MKNLSITIATTLTICFNICLCAQTTATWQGGKAGRATDWNCGANWKEGRVPNEFTQVTIPSGAHYYPIIKNASVPVDALLMEGGTSLTIEEGALFCILGETGIFDGITVHGKIYNKGALKIGEAVKAPLAFLARVQGNGSVIRPSTNTDMIVRRR